MTSPHGETTDAGGSASAAPGARSARKGRATGVATDHEAAADDLQSELAALWDEDKPPAAGPLANVASAVVLGLLGIAGVVGSLALGLGTPADPSAGMWPFIVSVILVVLAASLALFGRDIADTETFSRYSWAVLGGTVSLIGLVILIPMIGFEIPSLLLTFIWLRFLGKETWMLSTLLSFVITAAFYGVFVLLLGVPLPHLF